MGNKIESQKIKQVITELSETTDADENFLKTEFKNLFDLVGGDIEKNQEFPKIFKEILISLNEDYLINFSKNLIDYFNIQIAEKINHLRISLDILLLIVESIYDKNKNLRDILIFSIDKILCTKESTEEEIKSLVNNSFPFNILYFCINFQTDKEIFSNTIFFPAGNIEEKFKVSFLLSKIIYSIIYFQKNNDFSGKNFIEYFDSFKFFLSSESFFSKSKMEDFITVLFYTTFLNFNIMIRDNLHLNKPELENYILTFFYLFLWFCFDINKFFFKEFLNEKENSTTNIIEDVQELYFENEFNEKIHKFVENVLFYNNSNSCNKIIQVIQNYKKSYSDFIANSILYNTNMFKEFIFNFFSNYERFNIHFKISVKILLIYIFEGNHVEILFYYFRTFVK